ncbi:hypothetical protein NH26_14840 [Flammeovirga pacifica]|uniref:Uncharacterized protein n=1 Tax=Flammeovirga pacifica TaxID=915059 RepID=A0A1S1Z2Z7_FLAPC|nr:hypothetical protein NH26_14840 [Flammeovirga pacifica]
MFIRLYKNVNLLLHCKITSKILLFLVFSISFCIESAFCQEKKFTITESWQEILNNNSVSVEVLKKKPKALLHTYAILKFQNVDSLYDKMITLNSDIFFNDSILVLEKKLVIPKGGDVLLQTNLNENVNEVIFDNILFVVENIEKDTTLITNDK